MTDIVECYSSHDYPVRPTAFHWQGERRVVAEVIKGWRDPEGKCFHVRTVDEQYFMLCYDELQDEWKIDDP